MTDLEQATHDHLVALAKQRIDAVMPGWLTNPDFNHEYIQFTAQMLLTARELRKRLPKGER